MSRELIVQLWTTVSFIGLIVALSSIMSSAREWMDSRVDLQGLPLNRIGPRILGAQWTSTARRLFWVQALLIPIWIAFLVSGIIAVEYPNPQPQEGLRSVIIPIILVTAEFLLMVGNVIIMMNTRSMRRTRVLWKAYATQRRKNEETEDEEESNEPTE